MSFKIINPGYGYLVDPTFTTVHSSIYNPRFGVAFYGGDVNGGEGYIIPALGYGGLLCFKFDVYIPEEDFSTYFGLGVFGYGGYCALFQIGYDQASHYIVSYLDNKELTVDSETIGDFFKFNAVNTIWGRLKLETEFGEYDGECTIRINGKRIVDYRTIGTFAGGARQFHVAVDAKTPMSNLIVASDYISTKENIFRVNTSAIESTMAMESGVYVSSAAGEYILQTLDASNLRGRIGNGGQILGMAAIASPAYSADSDGTKMKCYTVASETTTTYAAQTLGSGTDGAIIEYLPVASDTVFVDLNGLQVGWVSE